MQQKDSQESNVGSAASSTQHSKGKARATSNLDNTDDEGNEDAEGAPPGDDPNDSDSDLDSDDEGGVARPSFNKDKTVEATMHEWLALQPVQKKYLPKDVRHNINVSAYSFFFSGALIQYRRDFVVL